MAGAPPDGSLVKGHVAVVVKTVLVSHFGVGEFTTHFSYFSGWIGARSLGADRFGF